MERNREKINENGKINDYITVLEAYRDGKEIEYRPRTGNEPWRLTKNPIFDFNTIEYRIKPIPAYRPYLNGDEAFTDMQKQPQFGWLYNTINMYYEQVICIANNGISTCKESYSFDEAFGVFIYPNNSKFGVKLDEKD